MAKTPFAPPVVAEPDPQATKRAVLPARARGEYTRWEIGHVAAPPPPAPPTETHRNGPPPPDPLQVAYEQAQQQGFEQGVQEGFARGEAEYAGQLRAVERSLAELANLRLVLAEVYRREMVEVALAAAEALVQRELGRSGDVLQSMIEQALAAIGTGSPLTLAVSPADATSIGAWIEREKLAITVRTDPRRQLGDFRLESAAGSVENMMHERIDRVRQLVLGQLAAETNG